MTLHSFSTIYYDHSISVSFEVSSSSVSQLLNDRIPHSLNLDFLSIVYVIFVFVFFICSPNLLTTPSLSHHLFWESDLHGLPHLGSFVLWIPGRVGQWDVSLGYGKVGWERGNILISPIASQFCCSAHGWITLNYSSCEVPPFQ